MRGNLIIIMALVIMAPLSAQSTHEEPTVGYVRLFTDADLIEIYIDGALIGYTPILDRLVLTPGWHTISFFPSNFKQDYWKYRQKNILNSIIKDGTRQVLVRPGELHEVYLEWQELDRRLRRGETNMFISSIIGVVLVGISLSLLALAQ